MVQRLKGVAWMVELLLHLQVLALQLINIEVMQKLYCLFLSHCQPAC